MRGEAFGIELVSGTGAGETQNVSDLTDMWLQLATVSGTPSGEIQIEGSIDGENYFNVGSSFTADGTLEVVPRKLTRLRANVTTQIAGGTWLLTLGAFNSRTGE